MQIDARAWAFAASLVTLMSCASAAFATEMTGDPATTCSGLAGPVDGAVKIDAATLQTPTPLAIAEKAPTPAARIIPANPAFCKALGQITPTDPAAPPIKFEVNLPVEWNGRSLQYGGGGFNGVLISGLGLPPAYPFDKASPLALGFVTVGTDSGHEQKPGEPPQLFALNDEAFENFSHKAYKKVRDAARALTVRAYGKPPTKMYFMGSSEGGREALTMAQRYPDDFDGIFARVPVINWVGLQHAGTRSGLVTMGDGWIRPAQVKLVADAVLKACDTQDGSDDALVQDPVGCKSAFKPAMLACAAGQSGDDCLTDKQIAAIETLHASYKFSFPLANGLDDYPGWGVSGENTPAFGPTGGWKAWWLGATAPAQPPAPTNGIAWIYGAGGIQYVFARDPKLDVTTYKPEDHKARVLEVSALMDSTDPDLTRFHAHGGKLVILEHMSDYAQSPYAGIRYFENVEKTLGKDKVAEFARLYTAPGVDHVGSGAPANVDMLAVLVDWVENGKAPGDLDVREQKAEAPSFDTVRALPLCRWPTWPHYKAGPLTAAASFACAP
ncbi:tannase/feruloyl esterase family alpha/beta hydrolase [Bradyrhizobium sp. AUGA SZCCT0051]|nr:tannase/feruloyl esterase family alpha/beta hydrolase [Bradyrhizobium sp. AUGA SZCCT0124]MBR1315250.1 tannase/feruloyl esterase family alpha/beta hydrolase [Bradyrhizobium sp. AUGA SZCCT0051]MBR1344970.1 tannase/feruloyl esterase family alpha/beta hydrolase [Bradyrhizobium sp. AUGA SZCCT0105]MBR1357754.1 tannase/feruloyl esterase family alpha/beta hydrolase [Bradyrhizobium sp. AUGA SZCCT0045]